VVSQASVSSDIDASKMVQRFVSPDLSYSLVLNGRLRAAFLFLTNLTDERADNRTKKPRKVLAKRVLGVAEGVLASAVGPRDTEES
jgi:hypothetical protein